MQNAGRLHWSVWSIALGIALLHMFTNGRYGFHRDELQFLSDSRHLAWGFVSYPPFTPAVERLMSALAGYRMVWLRLPSVLAQVGVVLLAGGMARVCGGDSKAQALAAFCTGCGTLELFQGTEFQYGSYDLLWCALLGYALVRILAEGEPRWWLLAGAATGMGLETKYTILFLAAAMVLGFVLTSERRLLGNRWFAAGLAIAVLLALPNLLWQVHHSFISLHFLQHIHKRDVRNGRGKGFWVDQFWIATLTASFPVWLAAVWRAARTPRWRPLFVFWLLPLLFFGFTQARGYYTAGVYPALLGFGAPIVSEWLSVQPGRAAPLLRGTLWTLLALNAAIMCAVLVPLADSGPLRRFALGANDDLRGEIGWNEIVARVAAIRDGLTPEQRAHLGIVTGNYGAQGAIDILGRPYGLPEAISLTNSAWLRTYPRDPQPTTLIVLGYEPRYVDEAFTGCRAVGTTANSEGVRGEEVRERPNIYLCGPPRDGWAKFWPDWQSFG